SRPRPRICFKLAKSISTFFHSLAEIWNSASDPQPIGTMAVRFSGDEIREQVALYEESTSHTLIPGISAAYSDDMEDVGTTTGLYDPQADEWNLSMRDMELLAVRQSIAQSYFLEPLDDDASFEDRADFVARQSRLSRELERVIEGLTTGTLADMPTISQQDSGIKDRDQYLKSIRPDFELQIAVEDNRATPAELRQYEKQEALRRASMAEGTRTQSFKLSTGDWADMGDNKMAAFIVSELTAANAEAKAMVAVHSRDLIAGLQAGPNTGFKPTCSAPTHTP
ncbi:MAG: hypothetical protein AAF213_00765, partial [Pseudomonadota bacterium]